VSQTPDDWTEGGPGLTYQACTGCGRRWYFQRDFCPHCGSTSVQMHASSCRGSVHAVTTVERAPSPEWRALAPYGMALIDLDEGVRVMTHAEPGLTIGDTVRIEFRSVNERLLPVAIPPLPAEKAQS